jgi:hypothetical protein
MDIPYGFEEEGKLEGKWFFFASPFDGGSKRMCFLAERLDGREGGGEGIGLCESIPPQD